MFISRLLFISKNEPEKLEHCAANNDRSLENLLLNTSIYFQEEDISTDSLPQLTVTRIECPVFTRKGEFVAAFVLPSSHAVNQWRHLKPAIRIN